MPSGSCIGRLPEDATLEVPFLLPSLAPASQDHLRGLVFDCHLPSHNPSDAWARARHTQDSQQRGGRGPWGCGTKGVFTLWTSLLNRVLCCGNCFRGSPGLFFFFFFTYFFFWSGGVGGALGRKSTRLMQDCLHTGGRVF